MRQKKQSAKINKGTEWHVEIYQNRYAELNEVETKRKRKILTMKKV